MRASLSLVLPIAAALAIGACAARQPQKQPPPKPLYAAHSATLDITYGINVIGVASLPRGFVPYLAHPPMWLREGPEIAVAGRMNGKSVIMGLSGPQLSNQRVIAQDFGPGAPGGSLLDAAVSPDGLTLATAVSQPSRGQLALVLDDDMNLGEGHIAATIDGTFEAAQLVWLDEKTIALAAIAPATSVAAKAPHDAMRIVTIGPQIDSRRLDRIACPLSHLVFSPNRYFAVGEGGPNAAPTLFDVHDESCREMRLRGSIRVLGWDPDSTAFIYSINYGRDAGVYRFDLSSGRVAPVAISSGAAAYASDGAIVAVGSATLTRKSVELNSNQRIKVEVARFDPHQPEIKLNSLGFETTPAMLAASRMVYTRVSDRGVVDIATPGVAGPLRALIEYVYPSKAESVIATGAAQGPIAMSWSPDGVLLAVVDGTPRLWTLTVMAPPR